VVEIPTLGKGQSPSNNPKVVNFVTGHIVDPNSLGEKVHRIPVCAGTRVDVRVTDTTGSPVVTENSDGISCTGSTCVVTNLGATEKYIARSSDGKDTDRIALLPR
jgi:V8-like Glu-specific endopeptidase